MEIVTNWRTDTRAIIEVANGQPVSRLYLPPLMTTAKATRPARLNSADTEAMKPTVFHIEQKYRSPS